MSPHGVELRIDSADGEAYSSADFVLEYGGEEGAQRWASAEPAPSLGDAPTARKTLAELEGPFLLQIMQVRDVGSPHHCKQRPAVPRLRSFQLSDGSTEYAAFEYRPLPPSLRQLGPGAHLRLVRVKACHGVLLLEPDTTELISDGPLTAEAGGALLPTDSWEMPVVWDPLDPPPKFSPVGAAVAAQGRSRSAAGSASLEDGGVAKGKPGPGAAKGQPRSLAAAAGGGAAGAGAAAESMSGVVDCAGASARGGGGGGGGSVGGGCIGGRGMEDGSNCGSSGMRERQATGAGPAATPAPPPAPSAPLGVPSAQAPRNGRMHELVEGRTSEGTSAGHGAPHDRATPAMHVEPLHMSPHGVELRIDSADGEAYSWADFVLEYGDEEGARRWASAEPAPSPSDVSASGQQMLPVPAILAAATAPTKTRAAAPPATMPRAAVARTGAPATAARAAAARADAPAVQAADALAPKTARAPQLDPELVAEMLAAGLDLAEVHAALGLTQPGEEQVPPVATAPTAAAAACDAPASSTQRGKMASKGKRR